MNPYHAIIARNGRATNEKTKMEVTVQLSENNIHNV